MAPEASTVSLTSIKPTGEPHLGNYIGAIKPALALARNYETIYFIADYHALTTIRDPKLLRHYSRSVAASWLAAGLDPDRTIFYRQSDVPEVFELTWILACLTGKGLMNRAHAYKAARDRNGDAADEDAGINIGLYNYPILMAVDILIMEADVVPVGKDQVQHVEIAADIAGSFNHVYGDSYRLKVPRAIIPEAETDHTLPGLDGRKMRKSYDNTISALRAREPAQEARAAHPDGQHTRRGPQGSEQLIGLPAPGALRFRRPDGADTRSSRSRGNGLGPVRAWLAEHGLVCAANPAPRPVGSTR